MEKVHDADLLSLQQVRDLVARAHEAQKRWATFSQAQIDAVIDAVAEAAAREAEPLATSPTRSARTSWPPRTCTAPSDR
jgi:acyl-CoA reductase-like NAD-dependent aldehyde dehydrogenase